MSDISMLVMKDRGLRMEASVFRCRQLLRQIVVQQIGKGIIEFHGIEPSLGDEAGRLKQVIVEQGPDMGSESVTVEFKRTSRLETAELLKRILTIPDVREEQAPH